MRYYDYGYQHMLGYDVFIVSDIWETDEHLQEMSSMVLLVHPRPTEEIMGQIREDVAKGLWLGDWYWASQQLVWDPKKEAR